MDMRYENIYSRNIGCFSSAEQEKLKSATVLVAGCGGVGGGQAVALARLGIGNLILADPGFFDPPDMNRQYGALKSSMDRNKAEVTAEMIADIAPCAEVEFFTNEALDIKKMLLDVETCDLVIDAIDYAGLTAKIELARWARENNLNNVTAPIPDFATVMMIFAPSGMTFEEFFAIPKDADDSYQIAPERFTGRSNNQSLKSLVSGATGYIPTNAGAAFLNAGVVATEVALILAGKRAPEEIVTVPEVTYIDILQRLFEIRNPYTELKNHGD